MTSGSDDSTGGILTKGQREYLESIDKDGVIGNGTSSDRVKRQRIRKRVEKAIEDFTLLAENLPERDREQIFSEYGGASAFDDGVIKAIEFLFLGLSDVGDDVSNSVGKTGYRNHAFDSALRLGVIAACEQLDMLVTEYEHPEYQTVNSEQLEQIRERILEGHSIGGLPGLRLLYLSGAVEQEDLQEFLLEQLNE